MKKTIRLFSAILMILTVYVVLTASSSKTDHSKDGLSMLIFFGFLGFGVIVTVIAILFEKKKKAKYLEQHPEAAKKPSLSAKPAASAGSFGMKSFQPYTGGGVCDVCNRSLGDCKAWIVPNDVFYSSSQYRQRLKSTTNIFGIRMTDADIDRMRMMDRSAGSAVCENCIGMFNGTPLPYPSAAPSSSASTAEIRALVDKLAHYSSLTLERTEEEEMGKKLLGYGTPAVRVIDDYLVSCGRGQVSSGWWYNAKYLVQLLPQFPDADCEIIFKRLMNVQTNIWEYHTQVKDVAEQELLKLKKAKPDYDGSVISPEDAQAELKLLYNSGKTTEERIKRAIEMQPSVESWSDKDKAFYYYVIADALKRRNADDKRRFAFYAAQIFYQPVNTSLGWDELKKGMPDREIHPSPEAAKQLHEEFSLPEKLDDLLNPET